MTAIVKSEAELQAKVIAAFDLGSNSIKMTVARIDEESGQLEEFLWRSETVRLGLGVDTSGRLAADRVEAALSVLQRFSAEARQAGATRLLGVATEATRIASNGQEFLNSVTDHCGIELNAISGDREATLTFLGLQGVVDLSGNVVVADIGGGSTEIIVARDEIVEWSRSYPLGSGRLTEIHVHNDPPLPRELTNCRKAAFATLESAPLADSIGGRLIVVGGTGEYMNRLIPADSTHTPAEFETVLKQLATLSAGDLSKLIDIPEARARVLPAGVAIAAAVADSVVSSNFEAAQSGIRRGLLLAAFAGEV